MIRLRSSHFGALSLVALAFSHCGDPSTVVPFASFERAVAEAACEQLATCPLVLPAGAVFAAIARHPAISRCADLYQREPPVRAARYRSSIDAGRIVYDGRAARACIDALAVTCGGFDQVLVGDANCQAAFRGTVPSGGTCHFDEECEGDAHCALGAGCPGVCQPAPTTGEACDPLTAPCSRNQPGAVLECTTTATDTRMHCVATSFPGAGVGGTCGFVDDVGDQQMQVFCEPGTYCKVEGSARIGRCVPPLPLGADCIPEFDACVDDALCTDDGSGEPRCMAFTSSDTPGSPCSTGGTRYCNPLARLRCDFGTCALLGTGVEDQPCRAFMPTDCDPGLYCDTHGSVDVCRPQIAEGAPCDPANDESCIPGDCDDVTTPGTPTCAAPRCE